MYDCETFSPLNCFNYCSQVVRAEKCIVYLVVDKKKLHFLFVKLIKEGYING